MKIDWKRKLTSRKFWTALIGFVTSLIVAFGIKTITPEQVQLVLGSLGVLVAYIVGEGFADGKNTGVESSKEDKVEEDETEQKSG